MQLCAIVSGGVFAARRSGRIIMHEYEK